MRSSRVSFLAALALVSSFAATSCSDDDESSSASGFINAYCALLMPCCAQAGKGTDPSQCTMMIGAFSGGAAFDQGAADACLADMQAASSSPEFCANGGTPTGGSGACDAVFATPGGTVPPGGACTSDSDCAASPAGEADCFVDFDFGPNGSSETRTCLIMMKGTAGSTPCVATVEGNVTYYSSVDGPPPTQGYTCNKAEGIVCDATTQACRVLGNIGDTCTSSYEQCVDSAYCDTTLQQCAARLPVGSACETFNDNCAETAYCDRATTVCVARLPDGAPCDSSSVCLSDYCVNDACAPPVNLTLSFFCSG